MVRRSNVSYLNNEIKDEAHNTTHPTMQICNRSHSGVCCILSLKLAQYSHIDLSRSEVVGDSRLVVVDVRNPIVGVDVAKVEKVECVCPYPYVTEVLG